MACDDGDSRIADIIKRMGVSAAHAGYYRRRLIELGVISSVGRGKVAIDLPMLKDRLSHDLRES
jgi:Mn-dependent DtxR family transcriptional regulator